MARGRRRESMRPLGRNAPPSSHASVMTGVNALDHERRLVVLLGPPGPELSCAECFDELDRYVELRLAAPQEADQRIPGMHAHLDGCPACADDYRSLLVFVAHQGIGRRLRALL